MRALAFSVVVATGCVGSISGPSTESPIIGGPGDDDGPPPGEVTPDAPDGPVDGEPSTGGEPGVRAIIGVGYGGLRVVSRDDGATWSDETHFAARGGDDDDLLRAISFGNGLWVAGGWRYLTSTDGVTWTDRGRTDDVIDAVPCAISESIVFAGGKFIAACGDNLASSSDGLTWRRLAPTPDIEKHPELAFDPATNRLAVTGDNNRSFVSSDFGATWSELTNVRGVRYCAGGLRAETDCPGFEAAARVFLQSGFPSSINRSVDGGGFREVYDDPSRNTTFTSYSFAIGIVPR